MRLAGLHWLSAMVVLTSFNWQASSGLKESAVKKAESKLLEMLGRERRPQNVDKSKTPVPGFLLDLYRSKNPNFDTTTIARPGLNTRSANTIRSFTHIGECSTDKQFFPDHFITVADYCVEVSSSGFFSSHNQDSPSRCMRCCFRGQGFFLTLLDSSCTVFRNEVLLNRLQIGWQYMTMTAFHNPIVHLHRRVIFCRFTSCIKSERFFM